MGNGVTGGASPNSNDSLGVGLLGVGVVGSAVAESLVHQPERFAVAVGRPLTLQSAVVRDLAKTRPVPAERLSDSADAVLGDDQVDVVIEVMGGETPAKDYITRALDARKHVVTANKEVLAKHGNELLDLAHRRGVRLLYEAAVGGGIPIIGPLSTDLLANEIGSIRAIINGTTNYILTRMTAEGLAFDDVLRTAQSLGYAEADPSADVDGWDAMYKIAILSRIAFKTAVPLDAIHREGIREVDQVDIRNAQTLGFTLKLLAVAQREEGDLLVRVHPALIPNSVPMAKVDGVLNACEISGDLVGPLWLQGRGAGAKATASAVLGDLIRVARRPDWGEDERRVGGGLQLASMEDHRCQYYIRLVAFDRAGVLAQVAGRLAAHDISIASVIQMDSDADRQTADIVLTTHAARELAMQEAAREIGELPVVERVAALLRIEDYPANE